MDPRDAFAAITLKNNTPVDDFCGLTPTEMENLLYDPFGEGSPLAVRPDIDNATLNEIPFFRVTEAFLRIVEREKQITLTHLGALPRKVLHELYALRFIPEQYIEAGIVSLQREKDSPVMVSVHYNTETARLARKTHGRLALTKEGKRLLLPHNRRDLFQAILASFTMGFAWSSNDAYPEFPVGQFGWGYTIYLLAEFGYEKRNLQFFVDKYLQAFPSMIEHFLETSYSTPQKDFMACYMVRVFSRFLEWFGFVSVQQPEPVLRNGKEMVTRTEAFDKVFDFS